jgi:hypothetical protein
VSMAPVRTACGDYDVRANLAPGSQPVTRMRIYRDGEEGGRYIAPLALNVKLTFTPVGRAGRELSMVQEVRFPGSSLGTWMAPQQDKAAGPAARWVRIDTDGDSVPDTLVPGPSNFRAGARRVMDKLRPTDTEYSQFLTEWHENPTHEHVVGP